ncbi:MAG: hypothetical protein Q9225_007048, partial [Loekoesia sp. 1 TL-2023]
MNGETDYSKWSPDKLVEHVGLLERQLREQTTRYNQRLQNAKPSSPTPRLGKPKAVGQFDPSRYSTRFIALKFAYLGQRYNGLEYHANNTTPYPTIEEELWKAMYKAKLIHPTSNTSSKKSEPNWDGCEYSKCGRTDKGVSAFGQVISLRVRSNRPLVKSESEAAREEEELERDKRDCDYDSEKSSSSTPEFDPIKDEIPYPQILNRLLPPEIRVLAWCPFPPTDFSARFSCTERCYQYFFTQPAFAPTFGTEDLPHTKNSQAGRQDGWLDIQAMREAARKFEGSHDFRNFCKVDPSKQIDIFVRAVNSSDIVEMKPGEKGPAGHLGLHATDTGGSGVVARPEVHSTPKVYAFQVRGSGFLWHQVRHMVAILFLVGQGLEKPSLIDDLLDIKKTPQKPIYDMADAEPLVLEDCKFGSGLQWVYLSDYTGHEAGITRAGSKGDGKYGIGSAVDELWKVWRRHKIDETLAGSLLDLTVQGNKSDIESDHRAYHKENKDTSQRRTRKSESQKIFLGGDSPRSIGKHIPVLERLRMETVDDINAKYLKRKGLDPPERNREKTMSLGEQG